MKIKNNRMLRLERLVKVNVPDCDLWLSTLAIQFDLLCKPTMLQLTNLLRKLKPFTENDRT